MGKERVWWSEDEKADLAAKVFGMQKADPTRSISDLVESAQKMWPPDRRRKILSVQAIPWLRERLRDKYSELEAAAVKAAVPPPPVEKLVEVRVEIPDAPEQAVKRVPDRLLLNEAVGRYCEFKKLLDEALELFAALPAKQQASVPQLPASKAASVGWLAQIRLPRALVVGLLGSQIAEIKDEFKNRADIRGWESGRGREISAAELPAEGRIFCMVSFVSHPTCGLCEKTGRCTMVRGGLTTLKGAIEGWLLRK